SDSHPSGFLVAGTTGARHHAQLIFIVLVEIGFQHVGQAGLEFLALSDQAASASQSAGITGMSHTPYSFSILNSNILIQLLIRSRLMPLPLVSPQVELSTCCP
uniref:Uncharacterized protein n=1 Tax=Macaca fascicularis TaxID=9541 RepID=A0A7N9D721_MACFA